MTQAVSISRWRWLGSFLWRAFRWDYSTMPIHPSEVERLRQRGIPEPMLARYLAWRRSACCVTMLFLLLPVGIDAWQVTDRLAMGYSRMGRITVVLDLLGDIALPVMAALAGWFWDRPLWSRRLLIVGAAIGFLTPFVAALIPEAWKTLPDESLDDRARELETAAIEFAAGVMAYILLMPTILAGIAGVLRACVRLKLLLPDSVVPGWFLIAGSPLCLLIYMVLFVTFHHLDRHPVLFCGLALIVTAPLTYLMSAKRFVKPLGPDGGKPIVSIQRWFSFLFGCGGLFIGVYLFLPKFGSFQLVGFDPETSLIGPERIVEFYLDYLGRSMFLTVLAADLFLWITLAIWQDQREFAQSPQAIQFDQRLDHWNQILRTKG